MSFWDDAPLHDFPDRAIRQMLEHPHNLRDLLRDLVPEVTADLDFDRVAPLARQFPLEDWRRREADLLFLIPYRGGPPERSVFLCVLVEHQSTPDPVMPLWLLLYAVLFWERERRRWEAAHLPGEVLRLTPVLPVVFHTGSRTWQAHRELADLIDAPEALRAFAPRWLPLFWDLAGRSPRALLEAAGEWLQALSVVRADYQGFAELCATFDEALLRLEGLHERDIMRWNDVISFLVQWVMRRRPEAEWAAIQKAVQESRVRRENKEEILTMAETYQRTFADRIREETTKVALAEGMEKGLKEGRQEGELHALRGVLRDLI